MRIVLLACLAVAPACTLHWGDDTGDDAPCLADQEGLEAPAAPLRNPDTLECESFGGGCTSCPCAADPIPLPSWGSCYSACENLSESECQTRTECRVVKDAECSIWRDCTTDFIGCFALDMAPDASIDCHAADAQGCSRNNECTAYHSVGSGTSRPFELCTPEGQTPGACYGETICDEPTPPCPSGHTAGIADGCYTGACIPNDLCGPVPL